MYSVTSVKIFNRDTRQLSYRQANKTIAFDNGFTLNKCSYEVLYKYIHFDQVEKRSAKFEYITYIISL